jgi:hypothetical protein
MASMGPLGEDFFKFLGDSTYVDGLDEDSEKALRQLILSSSGAVEEEFAFLYGEVAEIFMDDGCKPDRHKQGACMVVAFIKRLDIPPEYERFEKYREEWAVEAGLMAMYWLLNVEKPLSRKDKNFVDFLNKNARFLLPAANCDEYIYFDNLVLGLHKTFQGIRGLYSGIPADSDAEFDRSGVFLVPLIANILSLIESYNRLLADSGIPDLDFKEIAANCGSKLFICNTDIPKAGERAHGKKRAAR